MQLPREVIVGHDVLDTIGEICEKLGFSKSALIVAGSRTFEIAGAKVRDLLEIEGIHVEVTLIESASIEDVQAIEHRIKQLKPQIVVAVGGGTKIDVAKCSSASEQIPFISVPTTASHDGIASPLTSLRGLEKPYSVMAQAPLAIIADTKIIMESPVRYTRSGCGDVIAKLTAVRDWALAHEDRNEYYGGYAASLALMSAKLVIENADHMKPLDEEGLRVLMEALISCGVSMSIAGSSRPCSGSEHLFSHALEMITLDHSMHGERCGVGAIIMAHIQGEDWMTIKNALLTVGAPTTARELGLSDDEVVKAMELASSLRPERYTILNKVQLDTKARREIAQTTGVIN